MSYVPSVCGNPASAVGRSGGPTATLLGMLPHVAAASGQLFNPTRVAVFDRRQQALLRLRVTRSSYDANSSTVTLDTARGAQVVVTGSLAGTLIRSDGTAMTFCAACVAVEVAQAPSDSVATAFNAEIDGSDRTCMNYEMEPHRHSIDSSATTLPEVCEAFTWLQVAGEARNCGSTCSAEQAACAMDTVCSATIEAILAADDFDVEAIDGLRVTNGSVTASMINCFAVEMASDACVSASELEELHVYSPTHRKRRILVTIGIGGTLMLLGFIASKSAENDRNNQQTSPERLQQIREAEVRVRLRSEREREHQRQVVCHDLTDRPCTPYPTAAPTPAPTCGTVNCGIRQHLLPAYNERAERQSDAASRQDGGCHPGRTTFELATGAHATMSALSVGDLIKTPAGFEPVIGFSHIERATVARYFRFTTQSTALQISSSHYLFANGIEIDAADVRVGDNFTLSTGEQQPVLSIDTVTAVGLYHLFTPSATYFADGVATSTHLGEVDRKLWGHVTSIVHARYQLGLPVAPWDAEVAGTLPWEAGRDLYRAWVDPLPEPNAIADAVCFVTAIFIEFYNACIVAGPRPLAVYWAYLLLGRTLLKQLVGNAKE